VIPGRLKAILLLAWALIRTVLRRALGRGRAGLAAFRENYAADGLAPLSGAQRDAMETFGGCIACGLCDRGEGERMARSGGAYAGVMHFVLAASRSMPDYGAAALALAHVPDDVLEEKDAICPVNVPISQIARFVREKSTEARATSPG
jgi:hypothetical protein